MIVFAQMFQHTQKFIAFQPAELIEKTWAKMCVWSRELWSAPSWKPTWWPPIFFAFSDRKWIKKCLYQIGAKSYRFWKLIETAANLLKLRPFSYKQNEPFSTAERSERVENFLFRATREYTEAGIEQAIVAMRRLGANSPEPRKRAVREWHVSTQKTGSYITERSRLPGLIVGPCPSEESLCCPACPPALPCFRRVSAPSL